MITAFPEVWRPLDLWSSYQVSDRGHIRRRPRGGRATSRLTPLKVNIDGYNNVTLVRGKKERVLRVDWLVCWTFHGAMPDKDMSVQHIDGITWNDWASNLRWEYPIVATQWYNGPVASAQHGYFKYGPFKSKTEVMPNLKYGDVIVAFDDTGQIVAFEFVFDRDVMNSTRNPYDLARYWRATAKRKLMEVELREGMDMAIDPNRNPYDAAAQYRELAKLHPDFMWAAYLLDASFYIEHMADCVYKNMVPPPITVVSGIRPPLHRPHAAAEAPAQTPQAPPVATRRPITRPAATQDPPADAAPSLYGKVRRRLVRDVPPGFFGD